MSGVLNVALNMNVLVKPGRLLTGHGPLGHPPVVRFELGAETCRRLEEVREGISRRLILLDLQEVNSTVDQSLTIAGLFAAVLVRVLTRAGHHSGKVSIVDPTDECDALVAVEVGEGHSGLQAAEFVATVMDVDNQLDGPRLADHLTELMDKLARRRVNPDALLVRQAAHRHGLPTQWLDQEPFEPAPPERLIRFGLLQLGYGCKRRLVAGGMPAGDQRLLERIRCRSTLMPHLQAGGFPVPPQDPANGNRNSISRTQRAAERIGYPVVVSALYKPYFPHLAQAADSLGPLHGPEQVAAAFEALAGPLRQVWVEGVVKGGHFRFLLIGGKVKSICRQSVLVKSQTAPGQPGQEAVTDRVSASIVSLAEKAAAHCGLAVLAAVDMRIIDMAGEADADNVRIVNVLPDPDLVRHVFPDQGSGVDVADALVRTLFPKPAKARIPTAAVTGTNGKTTTCRMLQRILREVHGHVGLATTEGAFLNDEELLAGDVAGVSGAAVVLADDRCQAAVLETARGGLLKVGTAFDQCDVAACLNISADHIGVDGIDSLEAMARVKGSLLTRARQAVVVNADDPLCLQMLDQAGCDRVVLFGQSGQSAAISAHLENGGEAVFVAPVDEQPGMVIARGDDLTPLMTVNEIPATMNGLIANNISNALAAVAISHAMGVEPAVIRAGLAGFSNAAEASHVAAD